VKQNVISAHFPGASHREVTKLNRDWAGFHNICMIPDTSNDESIRGYFGEEVAFFFRWFGLYIRNLSILAFLGLLFSICYLPGCFTLTQQDRMLVWFGFALIIWETISHKISKADMARGIQVWGMANYQMTEDDLPSYEASYENSPQLSLRRVMTAMAVCLYVVFFMMIIGAMNVGFYHAKATGNQIWKFQPYVQTALVKGLSWLWRKIAYVLVRSENHRTQTRFNNSLIKNLSIVKLFVALYPFFYIAFIEQFRSATCEATLSDAARKVYGRQHWPPGVTISQNVSQHGVIPDSELEFLKGFWYTVHGEVCISGCYPAVCMAEDDNPMDGITGRQHMVCTSTCMLRLEGSLRLLYLTHIFCTTLFIVVPVVRTRTIVFREIRKAQQIHRDRGLGEVIYTLLQFQAKCHRTAPYDFSSWGGSWVEDFLELVVSYALLACFGVCYPLMSFIGFICLTVEYRLLAYRMTNVTCRPPPRGSMGIGAFQSVIEVVSLCALTANVGIVVTLMLPYRSWPMAKQLGMFIAAEKGVLLLRTLISFLIPDDPDDVRVIQDFNNHVKRSQGFKTEFSITEEQKCDYGDVDVGLAHRPTELPVPGGGHHHQHSETEGGSDTEKSDASDGGACW